MFSKTFLIVIGIGIVMNYVISLFCCVTMQIYIAAFLLSIAYLLNLNNELISCITKTWLIMQLSYTFPIHYKQNAIDSLTHYNTIS